MPTFFPLKITQLAFSTAHRTKSLYLTITLHVILMRYQSQHRTAITLYIKIS